MVRPNGSIMLFSFASLPAVFKIVTLSRNVAPDLRRGFHGQPGREPGSSSAHQRRPPALPAWEAVRQHCRRSRTRAAVQDRTCWLAADARATHHRRMQEFAVRPQPDDPRLTRTVTGIDHEGKPIETAVVMERPLTLFL